jgi:glycogenin glucosyltransferase
MRAFITLLSTPDYLPGVACLAASLRETGTATPLVVAIGAGVQSTVERMVRRMPGVSRVLRLGGDSLLPAWASRQAHQWSFTFDKLQIFGLQEFTKLVYLDSDMVVLAPLDDLFEAPHMAAVAAGRLVQPDWTRLNSGLMVIEPETSLPQRIASGFDTAVREMVENGRPALGDQDVINSYYADWPHAGPQLDQGYNVFFDHLEAYLASGEYALPGTRADSAARIVRIVHFTGRHKPWMARAQVGHFLAQVRGRLGPGQLHVLRTYKRLLRRVR